MRRPRGNRQPLAFSPDPKTWFARLMAAPGVKEAPLTAAIAVDASWLPGDIHGDPGDRLMVATARDMRLPLVTRDAAILAYSRQGFISVLPC